jgi:hypothetical protein
MGAGLPAAVAGACAPASVTPTVSMIEVRACRSARGVQFGLPKPQIFSARREATESRCVML